MTIRSILLAYATRFGSTQEVTEAIAAVLHEHGFNIEVRPVQDVDTLEAYDAIVVAAAIYNARWHSEAHRFLAQHQASLQRRPVAIVTLGPLSASPAALRTSRQQLDRELAKYPWLKPAALEIFAGKFDPSRPGVGFFDRFIPAHDYRDWTAIRAWANALPDQLQQADLQRERLISQP